MRRTRLSLLLSLLTGACAAAPAGPDVVTARGRRAARLVAPVYDPSRHAATCKVYHHVFAPDGRLLTKGDGGQFPHHRGLFVGWNRTTSGGETFDFWHLNHGESQRFAGYRAAVDLALPEGAQVCAVDWCAVDGRTIVRELRGLAVDELPDGTFALHVRVRLATDQAMVALGGDPQHSGHQFRALQRFADDGAEPVRYVRPDGATARGNDVWTDCEWIAAVLPLPDGPVTVLRVEAPTNRGDVRWSTRPYGRFGATTALTLTPDRPLVFDWYYVVAAGERDARACERTAAALRG